MDMSSLPTPLPLEGVPVIDAKTEKYVNAAESQSC